MDLTDGSETLAKQLFRIQPLKMDLTEGSETSAKQSNAGEIPKTTYNIQNTAKI
jgi:hypothetical protein